jgi:hypothetical protein
MFIPIWADMVVLLPTIMFAARQFRMVRPDQALLNPQWLLMLSCIVVAFAVVFFNRPYRPELSLAFFVFAIAAAASSLLMFRKVRRKR